MEGLMGRLMEGRREREMEGRRERGGQGGRGVRVGRGNTPQGRETDSQTDINDINILAVIAFSLLLLSCFLLPSFYIRAGKKIKRDEKK